MKKKIQIQVRNPLEKVQFLIELSVPFKITIESPIITASIFNSNGKKESKAPTDDLRNVVDWLWWKAKKNFPERFESNPPQSTEGDVNE